MIVGSLLGHAGRRAPCCCSSRVPPRSGSFGLFLTLFVGPAQSSSRTYLARLAPPGHEGQLFGLYATTGRAVSFLAPTLVGVCTQLFGSERAGIVGILVVLAAGSRRAVAGPRAGRRPGRHDGVTRSQRTCVNVR